MHIKKINQTNNELILNCDSSRLRIQPVNSSVVRITQTASETFADNIERLVLPRNHSNPDWRLEEKDGNYFINTADLSVGLSRVTGAIRWFDSEGNLLVKEPDKNGRMLEEVDVPRVLRQGEVISSAEQTADGEKARIEQIVDLNADRKAYTTRLGFEFSEGEALYGLGQHEEGICNYRGKMQLLTQLNMKVVMPVLVSSRGYAVLVNSFSPGLFRDDAFGSYFWMQYDHELDYYFIFGPQFDRIISQIRKLTGGCTMLPRWTYGYIQSKERYNNQQELLNVAEEYRRRGIGLDCVVQDWQYWPEGNWGYKKFDNLRFPDPKALADGLHEMDVKLMISIWPNMQGDDCTDRDEMAENGCLLGDNMTYNPFDPKARDLYWKQAKEGLYKYGIDAWWCDCTEPIEAERKGSIKPDPLIRYDLNTHYIRQFIPAEKMCGYSIYHSRGIYENQRKYDPARRVVNLTRSGSPGQQRYGAITWSGDISANWSTLQRQIAEGLNFTLTGNPKWTMDIGGFFLKDDDFWFRAGDFSGGCSDLGYRELYTRWLQLGVFLPMMRSHGTDAPREVWQFGGKGEVFYDTIVRMIELRYRLLPYIYSLAGWETHKDYTMLRHLAFDFLHDKNVLEIGDQFMLGPALMVCPVTEPMYYTSGSKALQDVPKERSVYLPAGSDWYDFWTHRRFEGGQIIQTDAPIETIPVFVKAGSILPLGPSVQHTGEKPCAEWQLRIHDGCDGEFEIYEDAGDGYGYEKGEFCFIPIRWEQDGRKLVFDDRRGEFSSMQTNRRFTCKVMDGLETKITTFVYKGKHKLLAVK